MLSTVALLVFSVALIYFSCEYFINGIEWTGRRLGIAETAVGSILAAIGTALPESAVTLVAVVSGGEAQKDIGVGAALGGPLVLSTIGYGIVGIALILTRLPHGRSLAVTADRRSLSRDQTWFLLIFVFKVALGLVVFAFKPWLGIAFLAAYAAYFHTQMRAEGTVASEDLEPLKLRRRDARPALTWILLQTLAAMALIFVGSQIFVDQLEGLGVLLGFPPQLIALLLSPVATELPETMSAVIWVRQGKERLALANISGSMMIQATVPSALGLFFTPWLFDRSLILAGAVTIVSILGLLFAFRRDRINALGLAAAGLLYGVFLAGMFWLSGTA